MASVALSASSGEKHHDDIIYPAAIPFALVHLAGLAAIWTGVTLEAVVIGVVLYFVRMFGVTAGYHRYFSHRTFRTGRIRQFLLAALAQSSTQRGVLWWAALHRHHHRHSDTEFDVHSPGRHGFFYSHVGWIFAERSAEPDYSTVPDLTRFPELVWLNRHPYLVPFVLAVTVTLLAGWPGLVVGFFWSTIVLAHCTFMINSLAHVHGRQRYVTGDDSRNNWWLALITLGEGWHNNHHAYQSSTRQGFRWWEIDLTYYALKVLAWLGVVHDLRSPPIEVIRNEQRLGRKVVERVAHQIAQSFPVEALVGRARQAWSHAPSIEELREKMQDARAETQALLARMHLPELPSAEAMREWVQRMYSHVPTVSLDEVAERVRELILETVSARLLDSAEPSGAT